MEKVEGEFLPRYYLTRSLKLLILSLNLHDHSQNSLISSASCIFKIPSVMRENDVLCCKNR